MATYFTEEAFKNVENPEKMKSILYRLKVAISPISIIATFIGFIYVVMLYHTGDSKAAQNWNSWTLKNIVIYMAIFTIPVILWKTLTYEKSKTP